MNEKGVEKGKILSNIPQNYLKGGNKNDRGWGHVGKITNQDVSGKKNTKLKPVD